MRSISPPGVHIRPLGLVSWFVGGAYAPIGGVYPSPGGVYPAFGSGFVACWGCILVQAGENKSVQAMALLGQVPEQSSLQKAFRVRGPLRFPKGLRPRVTV